MQRVKRVRIFTGGPQVRGDKVPAINQTFELRRKVVYLVADKFGIGESGLELQIIAESGRFE